MADATFRLALVPGVTPTGWLRTWGERLPDVRLELVRVEAADQLTVLREGRADAGLLRWPDTAAGDDLSAIPLFTETTVVVVPCDHLLTALDEVAARDLADEVLLVPHDDVVRWADPPGRPAVGDPGTTAEAVELVAAGVGVLVVPQSLARLHHRRDLTFLPMTDAPSSGVALVWPAARHGELVEELIGIVRGRTVNSSRGRGGAPSAPAAATAEPGSRQAVTRRPAPRRAGTRRAGGSASGGRRTGR